MAKRAGEASSSGERRLPEVLPKHTIFLSHSGHDKPFVERLCKELKLLNYSPFFDQNSDSLPRGEEFTPHLFKAAEQCLLAVIVLSERYLTSEWPLLELVAFVNAQKTKDRNMKLLPLFYKLSPSDLVPEKWMESWKKLAEDEKFRPREIELWIEWVKVLMKTENVEAKRLKSSIEHYEEDEIMPDGIPELVADAVELLRPFNGLEISKNGTSEEKFIREVVREISKIIPPMRKYNIIGIRGSERICEKASSLFEEGSSKNDVCKPGCSYLGFYGMGGVGKTTLCVAMCSFYQAEFRGRVCRVELQSDTVSGRTKRLKHVIRKLGGCDDRVLQDMNDESELLQCLQNQLNEQPAAFLAVDNVGDSESSRDEARRFISCGLACGSKVMVTSRSQKLLNSVLRGAKYCKPIPRLEEQEAEELFLSVAIPQKISSPLQDRENEIVKACIQESKFVDEGYDTQQYHPLLLRALGTFFHDVDPDDIMKWEKGLKFDKKLRESRESKRVNDILGLNYANLSDAEKLLFLDIVFLFSDEESKWLGVTYSMMYWKDEYQWAISLLAALHGISTFEADLKVKKLQRLSLIYESSPTLRVHDLYIEFARSLVAMEGSKENEWWVGRRDANGYNTGLKRFLLSRYESEIDHPPRLCEWSNLECLYMEVTFKFKLDLRCLPNLRVLNIEDLTEEATISCSNGGGQHGDLSLFGRKDHNRGCLPKLRMVHLGGFASRHIPFLRQCHHLTFLCVRHCGFDISDFPPGGTSLFENLTALETLFLRFEAMGGVPRCVFDGILQCATKMKNLKCLGIDFVGSHFVGESVSVLDLSPLRLLTSLTTLRLNSLPPSIEELVGLDSLSRSTLLDMGTPGMITYGSGASGELSAQQVLFDSRPKLKLPVDFDWRFSTVDFVWRLSKVKTTSG